MGDLLGVGDNLQIQVSSGQILFGSFASSNFFYYDDGSRTMSLQFGGASDFVFSSNNLGLSDGTNLAPGTTTGTKIGTATTQKLGFWNATPIVQPTTAVGTATFTANSGTTVNDASTFDGYTIKQIVKALRNIGILA